ncbi:MAG: acyl carrier protein [Chloroflexi bacterium]|nr:acyl carrier protein [Chloroflexota bacterium]MCI0575003.1 acyl carrier protein [Chloroflexota bacterium]MCI0645769.1 acyl carrier protein [Chloroflexota bacterium]MCI0727696.1 acyl carrier protein [Chloroflexota bacterium]
MNNIEQLIKEFITQEFLQDKPGLELNGQNLIEAGVIDSLGILMLINYLEQRLGAQIQPEDVVLENFCSIEAIKRLVEQRSAA